MRRWYGSDLIGIPVTLSVVGVFGLTIAAFAIAGPVAGFAFSIPMWIVVFYLGFRAGAQTPDLADIQRIPEGHRHCVLIVANQGLEAPALYEEIGRRQRHAQIEARIIVPVVASTPLHRLADEIDRESAIARRRLEDARRQLAESGVSASGHVDEEASPMRALLDGLREFPSNEVLMAPGVELDWSDAESLADRIRAEIGLPVTEFARPGASDPG